MLTSHTSWLHGPVCRHRRVSPSCTTLGTHCDISCAGHSGKQHGWPWPFGQRSANDDETEIVYVTDTAEADEVIEYPEYVDIVQDGQTDQAAAAAPGQDAVAADAGAAGDLPQPQVSHEQQLQDLVDEPAPEAAATALSSQQVQHSTQHQQLLQQHQHMAAASTATHSVTPARPAFASSSLSAVPGSGYWASSAGGWVVALSLLIAIRQGRAHADGARLDVRALQARQQDSRVQSRALREKRAQYLQQQQLLKEEAAAKRLAEQARETERARKEAAVKAVEYEKAAREELEQLRARRAAAKKEFEASQGKLQEELAVRTAREIALRGGGRGERAAEEAGRRAAAAAEAARAAAEAAAAADAAERAAREAAAARAALKQRLRDNSTRWTLQLQGTVAAAPLAASGRAPQLSVTLELLPHPAASSSSSTALPPPVAHVERVFDSPDAATEGAAVLALQAAQQVYNHYVPAAAAGVADLLGMAVEQADSSHQQQGQLAGQAPATAQAASAPSSAGAGAVVLPQCDTMLWRLLLLAKLEAAGRQAMGQVAPLAASGELSQDFQAQSTYSALPQSEPNSLQQRLQQCADFVDQQQLPAAIQVLNDIIEWHLEDFAGFDATSISNNSSSLAKLLQHLVSSRGWSGGSASPYLVPACIYAVLLNLYDAPTQLLNKRRSSGAADSTASSPDASRATSPDATGAADDDVFDNVDSNQADAASSNAGALSPAAAGRSVISDSDSPLQRLAKFQLEQVEKDAPADELGPVAACLQQLLGRRHPVAAAMQLLAERNMSPGARQARALRQQQKQLAMATELLKGSPVAGPGGLDPQGMRQQLVPAPERIWALRNVANSMLRSTASSGGGGASSSSTPSADEAVSMLRQACDLAAEHYGKNHPGCLCALLDYVGALLAVPGHQQEAKAAIEAVCGIVTAVGDRYRQQKDLLSLVLLYESTQTELDVPEVIGRECVAMTRLQRQAADAFSVLETAQANLVMSKRKLPPGSASTALRQLARDCTEQLGVYAAVKKRDTRLDQWNKGLPLAPLR